MPITRHLLCACNYIAINLMVCIWRYGGHVGGTTQKNMLLIPWSDQAAWVAKIVRHIPRDWLQTKNSLRFRRTNFIEWAACSFTNWNDKRKFDVLSEGPLSGLLNFFRRKHFAWSVKFSFIVSGNKTAYTFRLSWFFNRLMRFFFSFKNDENFPGP